MTFVFSAVAAVYIAFRETQAQWVFQELCVTGMEMGQQEKCWINDANCSCFGCLKTFHDLYLEREYYNLKHSAR